MIQYVVLTMALVSAGIPSFYVLCQPPQIAPIGSCFQGPFPVGSGQSHGFWFSGFSGEVHSRLFGDRGDTRIFTCKTPFALNTPVIGLVSPVITCHGNGTFPLYQNVIQTCWTSNSISGQISIGVWQCYFGQLPEESTRDNSWD